MHCPPGAFLQIAHPQSATAPGRHQPVMDSKLSVPVVQTDTHTPPNQHVNHSNGASIPTELSSHTPKHPLQITRPRGACALEANSNHFQIVCPSGAHRCAPFPGRYRDRCRCPGCLSLGNTTGAPRPTVHPARKDIPDCLSPWCPVPGVRTYPNALYDDGFGSEPAALGTGGLTDQRAPPANVPKPPPVQPIAARSRHSLPGESDGSGPTQNPQG